MKLQEKLDVNDNVEKITSYALPALGDIVFARFPMGHHSPKSRPALVVGVDEVHHAVKVVYGTTKKCEPSSIYPTEFLIRKEDFYFRYTGLIRTTKFDMDHEVKLIYNSRYFEIAIGSRNTTPYIGCLPYCYYPAMKSAAEKKRL